MPSRAWMRFMTGNTIRAYRGTNDRVAGLLPYAPHVLINPETRRKISGIDLGFIDEDGAGGRFYLDEFANYRVYGANSNVIISGQVGTWKSGFVKTYLYWKAMAGQRTLVIDIKDEYEPIASLIEGSHIVDLSEGSKTSFNPLDASLDEETRFQLTVAHLLVAMVRDEMASDERNLLWFALQETYRQHGYDRGAPTYVELREMIRNPPKEIAQRVNRTDLEVRQLADPLFQGLQRLTETDLSINGALRRQTSAGVIRKAPLTVVKCRGTSPGTRMVTVAIIEALTQSEKGQDLYECVIDDEAWSLSELRPYVRLKRRSFKIDSKKGRTNVMVLHHHQNLSRSSGDDAVLDLIADADHLLMFRLAEQEIRSAATELRVTPEEIGWIITRPAGQMLVKIKDRPGIRVTVESPAWLVPYLETRFLQTGRPDPTTLIHPAEAISSD